MNILSIELTTDEARSIVAQFIDQVETFSIFHLDVLAKGTEFEVSTDYADFVAQVEFYTEFDDCDMPDLPVMIAQSVNCKIKAYNKEGSEIQFRTEKEIRKNEFYGFMQSFTGIDIEEEVQSHFTV